MSKRLLLADDYPDTMNTLSDLCNYSDYEVVLTHNVQSAMEAISEELPDIIILDAQMLLASGYEVLSFLRQQPYGEYTTAVLLTSDTVTEDVPEAKLADIVMSKPLGIVDLLSILQARGEII